MEPDNRRLQIETTLRTLNENVPFRVRFKREPSVRGRVYGFECSTQRPSTELKVFIEYPIGEFSFSVSKLDRFTQEQFHFGSRKVEHSVSL